MLAWRAPNLCVASNLYMYSMFPNLRMCRSQRNRRRNSFRCENDIFMRILMSFFTGENLIFSHECRKLMRVSWDSREKTFSRKLCFCLFWWMYRVIPSIRRFLLRMWFHEFSWSHAEVNIRCMHVVFVKENHFEVLSSSKLNMFTGVETRLCILVHVHVRVLVTWQRTNSVTIDRVTVFDHEAIVQTTAAVIRSFCGLRLRSF